MSSATHSSSPNDDVKTEEHTEKKTSLAQTISSKNNPSGKNLNYIAWDDYFMALALLTAKRSKDPVTQVGACIVNDQNRIITIGYNGMPYGCSDDVFPWVRRDKKLQQIDSESDEALVDKNLYVVHAEANAILNRNSLSIEGARIYTTLFPCNECAKLIIQSRLKSVIFLSDAKSQQLKYRASKRMLDAAGITYTKLNPERKHISIDLV